MKQNPIVKLSLIVLLASLAACGDNTGDDTAGDDGTGDDGVPLALQTDLQAILDDAVANQVTPGAVVHVTAGDATWSGVAGLGDLEHNVAISADDQLRAGSILKTFVATAVLQAVDAGTLRLDDVLTDHLPAAVTDRIEHADTIQLGMLLAHRTGVPDWVTDDVLQAVATDPEHIWTLDEILVQVEAQPALFPPGTQFSYSNTNYILLGEILTAVSGRSWREVVRADVIASAGLTHTTLPDPGNPECPGCAHGYIPFDADLVDFTRADPSMAGASGGHALITTPADLSRFLAALRDGALVEPATLDAMLAFQPAPDPMSRLVGYGLGVMQLDSGGNIAIGHLGGTAGYQSFMLHVPATDRYLSGYINVMGDLGAVLEPVLARAATP